MKLQNMNKRVIEYEPGRITTIYESTPERLDFYDYVGRVFISILVLGAAAVLVAFCSALVFCFLGAWA